MRPFGRSTFLWKFYVFFPILLFQQQRTANTKTANCSIATDDKKCACSLFSLSVTLFSSSMEYVCKWNWVWVWVDGIGRLLEISCTTRQFEWFHKMFCAFVRIRVLAHEQITGRESFSLLTLVLFNINFHSTQHTHTRANTSTRTHTRNFAKCIYNPDIFIRFTLR